MQPEWLWIALVLALAFLFLRRRGSRGRTAPAPVAGRPARTAIIGTPDPAVEAPATADNSTDGEEDRKAPEALAGLQLCRREDLGTDGEATVARLCSGLSDPHPALFALSRDPLDVDSLADVVRRDPGLSADVLRTVNAAAFALASPIASVPHAVTYLGMGTVQGIIAAAAASGRAPDYDAAQRAALARITCAAGVAAAMGQLLAAESAVDRPSLVGTRALFANLGDLAFLDGEPGAAAWYEEGSTLPDRLRRQQAATGLDMPLLGALLAERWGLPAEIADAIEHGADPLLGVSGAPARDRVLVYCAARIGDRVAYGELRDLSRLAVTDRDEPEYHHLPDVCAAAGLDGLPALLGDPGFVRKANGLLRAWHG